ncbi:MAG: 1-acyl-sn-glycerol-3-phosphate acyltransferase, partial [Oscillospiraceae bacterium]|nr:1-acyl-sn-glycerol-3-phosphate acyltransferase [Oscillospiraceae bacterium]
MDVYERHQRIWRLLYVLSHRFITPKFHMTHEDLHVDGPVILIPNHVNAWDPLLVAMSLPQKQVYYVASEHIFRLGFVSRLLNWLVAPIPRRKASSGTDTVKACL